MLAAVITPPDPFSQLGLALPLILLYEVSIWCARLTERRKAAAEEAGEEEEVEEVDDPQAYEETDFNPAR